MKKVALMFLFSLMIFSCKKETDKKYPENPDWLTDKISQMKTADYYAGTIVYAYEWNNEYYYLISVPLSSCIWCDFFNYQGVKVEWTQDIIDDFPNARMIRIVWQRV